MGKKPKKERRDLESRKKRRKKFFNEKVSMSMYHKAKNTTKPVAGIGKDVVKVMSNKDRRALGIEQDSALPDFRKE